MTCKLIFLVLENKTNKYTREKNIDIWSLAIPVRIICEPPDNHYLTYIRRGCIYPFYQRYFIIFLEYINSYPVIPEFVSLSKFHLTTAFRFERRRKQKPAVPPDRFLLRDSCNGSLPAGGFGNLLNSLRCGIPHWQLSLSGSIRLFFFFPLIIASSSQ